MSAERDSQQGMTFNFTNFYHLYRHEKLAKGIILKAQETSMHTSLTTERASETLSTLYPQQAEAKVISSEHSEEMKKWSHLELDSTKKDLMNQMRSLRNSRKRLQFLMNEVDEILKRS